MKVLHSRWLPFIASTSLLAACGSDASNPEAPGSRVSFDMGALSYPGATDVCYSFSVVSGLDQLVIARGFASTITSATRNPAYATWGANTPYVENAAYANGSPLVCASQFGNGAGGDWSYVAPCDASDDARTHTVTVWLEQLYVDGETDPLAADADYQDPCPTGCSVQVACTENADTPVSFNFTIMRRAQQGFFDIGVNFDDVFCSAKLDSCYVDEDDNVTPIGLVFDTATGVRGHTAVAAVACSVGQGADLDTALFFTDFVVTCGGAGGGTYTIDLSTVASEGNFTATDPNSGNELPVGVYFGREALPDVNKVFANVAFVLPNTGEECFVSWTVVPTEGAAPPNPTAAGAGVYTYVSAVVFGPPEGVDAPGAAVQYGVCHSHPLNGQASTAVLPASAMANFYGTPIDSGVYTDYIDDAAVPFSARIAGGDAVFTPVSPCQGPTWDQPGDLIIAPGNPPPPNLECLASVGGYLVIDQAGAYDLDFASLATIDGGLVINGNSGILNVDLPKLASVGPDGVGVYSSPPGSQLVLDMPSLTTVAGPFGVQGNAGIVSVTAPALSAVGVLQTFGGNQGGGTVLLGLAALPSSSPSIIVESCLDFTVSLPALQNVDALAIYGSTNSRVQASALVSAASLEVAACNASGLDLPALSSVDTLSISYNTDAFLTAPS